MPALSLLVYAGDLAAIRALVARKALSSTDVSVGLQGAVQATPPDMAILALLAEAADGHPYMAFALRQAVSLGRTEVVRVLLAHRAPAGPLDDDSALHQAAAGGHVEIVAALLDAGADPDHIGKRFDDPPPTDGRNALFAAIQRNDLAIVRLLLARGASVNLVSARQRCPLDIAIESGNPAVIALLEQAGARRVGDDLLDLPNAIEAGAVDRVRALAATEGADAVRAALEKACYYQDREACIAALLDGAPEGVVRSQDLADAIFYAARSGRGPSVSLLLARGVSAGAEAEGEHPLFAAARADSLDVVERLLAAGAPVDQRTAQQQTALHGAAQLHGSTGVLERLLAAGADPTLRDAMERTAYDVAKEDGCHAARAVLKKVSGKRRSSAQIAASAKKKVAAYVRTTRIPILGEAPAEDDAAASRFGGFPGLRAGEAWPGCGRCGAPMAFFFQLDTATLGGELRRTGEARRIIQWFFCTSCAPFACPDPAALVRAVPAAEIVSAGRAPEGFAPFPGRSIVGWSSRKDYPWRDAGKAPDDRARADLDRAEVAALDPCNVAGTKSGGWPRWLQDVQYPADERGPLEQLVIQLDTGGPIPYDFGDSFDAWVFCATGDLTRFGWVWQCV